MIKFCKQNHIDLWLGPVETNHRIKSLTEISLKHLSHAEMLELEEVMKMWAESSKDSVLLDYVSNCLAIIKNERPKKIHCPMGTKNFVLDPNGNLYPCFLRKDILLGNVYNQKIKKLLNNPKLKQQQKNLQKGLCVRLGCICMTISSSYHPKHFI